MKTFIESGYRIDLIAVDKEEEPILLGVVRPYRIAESDAPEQLTMYLQEMREPPPFALAADLAQMRLFRWENGSLSAPVCVLNTIAILELYDPEIAQRQVFARYLTTLVEAWLRDLASHWKSERPPATDELSAVGFLQLLEGGWTESNVELNRGRLHRN